MGCNHSKAWVGNGPTTSSQREEPVPQEVEDPVPQECDAVADVVFVEEAGVAEVNGTYTRRWRSGVSEDRDGEASYGNEHGILLFRYSFSTGNRYWYLSDSGGDLRKASGDYYRVKSDAASPPLEGWNLAGCAKGEEPVPRIIYGVPHCDATIDVGHATADEPTIQLVVNLMSGEELTTVMVSPFWKGVHVKRAIAQNLEDGRGATKLVVDTEVFRDWKSVADMDLADGSIIQAVVVGSEVVVTNSGTPAVNGNYIRQDEIMNGAVCFRNEAGTLLFKYVMKGGSHFWYFSKDGNLAKSSGDYYRSKTTELLPPAVGWTMQGCPMGSEPLPEVELLF